ncbi:MAG: hypothetical protein M5U28_31935 [Sandaracinaceae bacterium]|nr:hypothetical protein [Sandaracinaceae bacterium]
MASETVHVVQHLSGGGTSESDVATDASGALTFAIASGATSVDLTDRFGNAVTITL